MKSLLNKKKFVSSKHDTPKQNKIEMIVNKIAPTFMAGVVASQACCNIFIKSPVDIFNNATHSIVTVSAMDIHKDPFSPGKVRQTVTSTGTGFSYRDKKYIVTNAHVIQDAFNVRINDVDAITIGVDIKHDIALLEVSTDLMELTPLKKCTTPAMIGESVLAIGNPFGLDKSMTSGIISGINRLLDSENRFPLFNLLQTDAAINAGNSGGPLLEARSGCVLGVNTAIISPSGGSSGVGFAIPIDVVDEIVDKMLNHTSFKTLQLGISCLPDKYAEVLGIPGVIIADVLPDGIADTLGLKGTSRDDQGRPIIGDVIIGLNEKEIKKGADLYDILDHSIVGDLINLRVSRSDGVKNMSFYVK